MEVITLIRVKSVQASHFINAGPVEGGIIYLQLTPAFA